MSTGPEISIIEPQINTPETTQEPSRFSAARRFIGRGAIILSLGLGGVVALEAGEIANAPRAEAATFLQDYPNTDAPCEFGAAGGSSCTNPANMNDKYDWYVDEDGNGHYTGSSELYSSRLYGYRNCTDGVAWWVSHNLPGYSVPSNWGNANNWDDAAPSSEVYAGTTSNIEPGDIAQSDDGGFGHVGFVTSVTKNADGTVASFSTAELNSAGTGEYSTPTYTTKNAAGKFSRGGSNDWDHFIDVNGIGKGLNNEAITSGGSPSSTPNLFVIQHNNTPSVNTEAKELSASSNYTSWIGGWVTPDGVHSGSDVDYGIADNNGDGIQDIYKIQHQNTASGMTEVAVLNGATNDTTWIGGWTTPEGVHSGSDVHYAVSDFNGDGKPDVIEIQTQNTGSGHTEVKVLNGATNNTSWIGGWVTPEGWHNAADVDFVASKCGTAGAPSIYEIQHSNTGSGMTEVKELSGASNYTSWIGGWVTPEGVHGGDDVNYVASGCNTNGKPNIYEIQHQNTSSGMTEVKELNGASNFTGWVGGWVTPDGVHTGNDVDYVMPQ